LAIRDLARTRLLAFGIGWYLLTVALVLQWIPVGGAIIAERYTYLSYVGLLFIVAMAVAAATKRNRPLGIGLWSACAVFAAFAFGLTVRQVETWKDDETLWTAVIRVHPQVRIAYLNRGLWYGRSGRVQQAMSDLQVALHLGVRRGDLFDGLGSAYG